MVASKKEKQNSKIYHNHKRKQKQTICIIGYFHNILLSVALEKYSVIFIFICQQGNNTNTKKNKCKHTRADIGGI